MLYDFRCPAGHTTEKRVNSSDVVLVHCACGLPARRSEVNRIGVSGFAKTPGPAVDFHDDYRRFSEASSEIDYSASKAEKADGLAPKNSPLFKMAKAKAAKMAAAGVHADDIK
jgi:hypothetical protein